MSRLIKCLSYNIHKGFSHSNARYLLDEIRYAMRQTDADIVFLQEVIGQNDKHQSNYEQWPEDSQFEFLADQVWPHFAYGKNAIYQHGHHGNAILSKHPFKTWNNVDISRWKFSQRGILYGVIHPNIHVYCLHLGLLGLERKGQYQQLIQLIKQTCPDDAPFIIAGDFNDWQGSLDKQITQDLTAKEVFKSHTGQLAKTFPAKFPMLPMDRIYTRGVTIRHAERLLAGRDHGLSDHCALYTELELF